MPFAFCYFFKAALLIMSFLNSFEGSSIFFIVFESLVPSAVVASLSCAAADSH
jgi:hypothetical protein